MLRTALNQHPSIACAGELLNPNKQDLPYTHDLPTTAVLEQYAYPHESGNKCSGFVHHAYHPGIQQTWPDNRSNPNWENIWQLLTEIDDLKVIHLYRKNLVWRHLSQVLARNSGHWQTFIDSEAARAQGKQYQPKPRQRPAVNLDAELMQQDFQETLAHREQIERFFTGHPILPVVYEQLCADFDGQVRLILDFLEMPQHRLTPELIKLEDRQMPEAIKNYQALKQQFSNTAWAGFFVD